MISWRCNSCPTVRHGCDPLTLVRRSALDVRGRRHRLGAGDQAPNGIDRRPGEGAPESPHRFVEWVGGRDAAPQLGATAEKLAAWDADTLDDERSAHDRPTDPAASYSGHWWSTPAIHGLISTTRALPGIGAVGLALVEDNWAWTDARCWPHRPRSDARIYEITGPDPWVKLVNRYPLDVSRSRLRSRVGGCQPRSQQERAWARRSPPPHSAARGRAPWPQSAGTDHYQPWSPG